MLSALPVVIVRFPGCDRRDCHVAQKSCYYTLLHITTPITILGPVVLSRVMDHRLLLEAHLRDTSWKGGCVRSTHHIHPWESARVSGSRYGDHTVRLPQRLPQLCP